MPGARGDSISLPPSAASGRRAGAGVGATARDRRELTLAGGAREPFDKLVVAPGARAVAPPIPGAEATEPARTLEAAERLSAQVGRGGHDAVVVGAGYIGLEMA